MSQLADPESLHRELRRAIDFAEQKGWSRPQFLWFDGEDDHLVSNGAGAGYTVDDKYGGVVAGSHSTIKLEKDPQSTLVKRIVQELAESISTSNSSSPDSLIKPPLPTPSPSPGVSGAAEHAMILVGCTARKSDADETWCPDRDLMSGLLGNDEITAMIRRGRVRVLNAIQQGRVRGVEFVQGNRLAREENRRLIMGPDFGGLANEQKYLPAYARYRGRTFHNTKAADWEKLYSGKAQQTVEVWIMSGLYGLLPAAEAIQNYDCHLTDVVEGDGGTLADFWRPQLTAALVQRLTTIRAHASGDCAIRIIDLLGEQAYRSVINWQDVYQQADVYHCAFRKEAGRDTLDNIGWYLGDLIHQPDRVFAIKHNEFYAHPTFLDGDEIVFEHMLGALGSKVAR